MYASIQWIFRVSKRILFLINIILLQFHHKSLIIKIIILRFKNWIILTNHENTWISHTIQLMCKLQMLYDNNMLKLDLGSNLNIILFKN